MTSTPRLSTVLAVAATAATATTALAASTQKITPSGVGGVKIGKTYTALRQEGLIGKIHHGCELGGPNTRSANLKSPLKGAVDFTLHSPRKVTDITINGGAKARGVGIGATIAQIKGKFPKAKVDHSGESTFQLTFVRVPKNGGGKIEFGVSTKTHKTTVIGVPLIAVCD